MKSSLLWLAAAVAAVGITGRAQQPVPARDARAGAPAPPIGTASISGTVLVGATGQPARRARVNLSGVELRGGRTATTDEQGNFAFAALPAGRYNLSASKPGHVTASYGQRQPGTGRPGTPIQLSDGQKFDVRLQLPRGGVITGTILDEHAEPHPGTQVRVMRHVMQGGVRTLQGAGGGATDDRGIYRVYGLQPGEYVVCAAPRNTGAAAEAERMRMQAEALRQRAQTLAAGDAAQAQQLQRLAESMQAQAASDEQQTGYAPVCYPGTTNPSSAGGVAIGVSEERAGVDFQLQLVPIASVEGTVVYPTGVTALQNLQVSLVPAGAGAQMPGIGNTSTRPGPGGGFRLANVAPGSYTLFARGTIPAVRPDPAAPAPRVAPRNEGTLAWAMADIAVDGRPVTDVLLSMQPGMSLSGQLAFNGALAPPADLTRLRVNLIPMPVPGAPPGLSVSSSARVEASGRFRIASVVPGRYRVSAGGASGWTVESAVVSGQDALDFPLEVRPNQSISGALLTFTDRQTELTGTVTDSRGTPASGYTLVIFASDERYWAPGGRRIQTTRPATDGGFAFRNLPPGEYRLATLVDPDPGAWTDPSYLQQLEPVSMRVSLAAGEKKVRNVRLAGSQ